MFQFPFVVGAAAKYEDIFLDSKWFSTELILTTLPHYELVDYNCSNKFHCRNYLVFQINCLQQRF